MELTEEFRGTVGTYDKYWEILSLEASLRSGPDDQISSHILAKANIVINCSAYMPFCDSISEFNAEKCTSIKLLEAIITILQKYSILIISDPIHSSNFHSVP